MAAFDTGLHYRERRMLQVLSARTVLEIIVVDIDVVDIGNGKPDDTAD